MGEVDFFEEVAHVVGRFLARGLLDMDRSPGLSGRHVPFL
jgi:hypothetical protein